MNNVTLAKYVLIVSEIHALEYFVLILLVNAIEQFAHMI